MALSEHKFYKKGPNNQKRADVTILLKRPDIKDLKKYSQEDKEHLREFITAAENSFL